MSTWKWLTSILRISFTYFIIWHLKLFLVFNWNWLTLKASSFLFVVCFNVEKYIYKCFVLLFVSCSFWVYSKRFHILMHTFSQQRLFLSFIEEYIILILWNNSTISHTLFSSNSVLNLMQYLMNYSQFIRNLLYEHFELSTTQISRI